MKTAKSKFTLNASFAIGVLLGLFAIVMLCLGIVKSEQVFLYMWIGLTFASAVTIRWGTKFPAFSVYSLIYSVPVTLASVSMTRYLLDPPPSGPAGGVDINAGIAMQALAVYAPVVALVTLISFRAERRSKKWYLILGAMYLPSLIPISQVVSVYLK